MWAGQKVLALPRQFGSSMQPKCAQCPGELVCRSMRLFPLLSREIARTKSSGSRLQKVDPPLDIRQKLRP